MANNWFTLFRENIIDEQKPDTLKKTAESTEFCPEKKALRQQTELTYQGTVKCLRAQYRI